MYIVISTTNALPLATMPTTKRKVTFAPSTGSPASKKARRDKEGTSKGDGTKQATSNKKKDSKKLDPRFAMIRRLVEGQPTEEFQSMLFSYAEKTLSSLKFLKSKDSGVGKFLANVDYIPGNLDFDPPLTFPDFFEERQSND